LINAPYVWLNLDQGAPVVVGAHDQGALGVAITTPQAL
jgi:hypothetical protein